MRLPIWHFWEGQAFEKAKKLPRSQQEHILKVVEAFVDARNGSAEG